MAGMKHGVITLTGATQRLSTLLGATDVVRAITLQPGGANANPIYVGGPAVDGTTFGVRLEAAVATVPPAPWQLSELFGWGHLSLEDVYVRGTNTEKLHVLWLPQV